MWGDEEGNEKARGWLLLRISVCPRSMTACFDGFLNGLSRDTCGGMSLCSLVWCVIAKFSTDGCPEEGMEES